MQSRFLNCDGTFGRRAKKVGDVLVKFRGNVPRAVDGRWGNKRLKLKTDSVSLLVVFKLHSTKDSDKFHDHSCSHTTVVVGVL